MFLSNQWPRGFQQKLPDGSLPIDLLPDSDLPAVGAEAVAELACAPRLPPPPPIPLHPQAGPPPGLGGDRLLPPRLPL